MKGKNQGKKRIDFSVHQIYNKSIKVYHVKGDKKMKNKICEKKNYFEENKESLEFSVGCCVLLMVVFMVSALFREKTDNSVINYVIFTASITGIFFCIVTIFFHLINEKQYRYKITCYKDKTKNHKKVFKGYNVYLDKFCVDGDGHFFIDTDEKSGPYKDENFQNHHYFQWLYDRNLLWKYDFYTEIYDSLEKKILDENTIKERFFFDCER